MVLIFLAILASLICEYRPNRSREPTVTQLPSLLAGYLLPDCMERAWRTMVLRGSEESRLNVLCLLLRVDIRRRLFLVFLFGNSRWHGEYWSS